MTITIREALQLPDMVQTRLVGGAAGLDNPIRWVTIVEVLEDVTRLQEGEFLITTGFGLSEDEQRRASLIPSLAERKLSGVALHTGFYLREIPADLVHMADRFGLPLIEIPVEMNFSTITKAILQPIINRQFETLAYSQAIHNRMIEAALSKGGLPAIAAELAQLTGGAVKLVDALGFEVVQHGGTSGEAIAGGKTSEHAVPIRASREHFGTLTLTKAEGQWKELDDVALQHAATLCALEYVKERAVAATEWRLKGDFVDELLSGRPLRADELDHRSRMLGYPLTGSHMVAAVKVGTGDGAALSDLHQACITLMRRLCDRHHRSYLLRERPHCLLFILPHDQTSLALLEQFAARWERLHPASPLQVALSNPRGQLTALAEAAEEALFALQAYPLLARSPALLRFGEMRGYQFLFPYHRSREMLEALWQPLLDPLIRYDARHNQQLLETLSAYLDHNGNGLKTSQALYIHRHTLKYRLTQIEDKTGVNLEDAHQRWQLRLALMARRLQQQLYPAEA
ncbi:MULTISPECIES: PucR family transcriptional regulator [Brevibacillus]|jgi:purine catabolism regulator|uniref:Transcriptional regulator n=1 Tax=Brevibacillus aydinogluensis TaxID=927786 RepID=A0AA48MBI8_9BACL|nr:MULTISPECIES: PucR family transcriptional regulator [Bacillales]REK61520.1 MAG: PucR family transcriptional regulator [Brevibacillus sp.]MBR8661771.1 PucR family transcriptional regulator ligand-binding domain-containing protein [Brevibacillus sp. NL20B1]MDT3416560.1 purine catabolism regulator [Brevibacillus aydinogluensis]UFJ60150.1 PucR family transcriptional regulator ligand-binding domain-containing protein [Anoxybacillus sediminis]CAJ1003201.1 Transcriptional regulator [Brevibacillus 